MALVLTTSRHGGGCRDRRAAPFRAGAWAAGVLPVHEYFRAARVPLLAVWGEGDEIFGPDGARAFARDLPDAEIHLVPGGHFLLESALDVVVGDIRGFLGRALAQASDC